LSRTVKGTASFIGPSMTAIFAPAGSAGTSVHTRSDGVTNVCPSAAYAGGIRKVQSPPKRTARTVTHSFLLGCLKGARYMSASGGWRAVQNARNTMRVLMAPGATIVPDVEDSRRVHSAVSEQKCSL
jgi:hypothetical protein